MSRHIRFVSLGRSVWRSNPDLRHRVRLCLFLWVAIILILLAVAIFTLAIFIYLVPCPVWSGGQLPMVLTLINGTNTSDLAYVNGTTRPPLSFASQISYDFYIWKCPLQAVYFIDEISHYPGNGTADYNYQHPNNVTNQTLSNASATIR